MIIITIIDPQELPTFNVPNTKPNKKKTKKSNKKSKGIYTYINKHQYHHN